MSPDRQIVLPYWTRLLSFPDKTVSLIQHVSPDARGAVVEWLEQLHVEQEDPGSILALHICFSSPLELDVRQKL